MRKLGAFFERGGWLGLVLVVIAGQYAALVDVPFLSEDWTHLAELRSVDGLGSALDLAREPLRPAQHAWFWILAHGGGDPLGSLPALARLPGFLLHAFAAVCVFALARLAGLERGAAGWAAILFACFPNVKSLAWPAAIGSPGKVAFALAALVAFALHARSRSVVSGLLGFGCAVLALSAHESALLVPMFVVAWHVFVAPKAMPKPGPVELDPHVGLLVRAPRIGSFALRPWFVLLVALVSAWAVHLAFFRDQRHHALKDAAALPANVAKALLSPFPEDLRVALVEALRGAPIGAAVVLAALGSVALGLLALREVRRSGPWRWAAVCIGLDLSLCVMGAGFVQRYAYFTSACLALALVHSAARARSAALVVALIGSWWAHDSWIDVREIRAAGASSRQVLERVRAERERVGEGLPIAILDASDMGGSEADIPVWNWGLPQAIEEAGIRGPFVYWRTRAWKTSTDFVLVQAATLEHARVAGRPSVLDLAAPTLLGAVR